MANIGSGAQRKTESVKLFRYACYLIVQNADLGKEVVALGQLSQIRTTHQYWRTSHLPQ